MFEFKRFNINSHEQVDLVKLWWNESTGGNLSDLVRSDYGFMCYLDGRPMASIFLYPTIGSRMAMIGFPIANPLLFKEERREAIKALVAHVEGFAKELKYDYLISYAGNKSSQALWGRENYKIADKEVVQFYKRL